MAGPPANEMKVFVPAKDWPLSRAFYAALGCTENWSDPSGLAEFQIGATRFLLQNYYHKQWAENFVMQFIVDDARAWYEHAKSLVDSGGFGPIRVRPPKTEPWGQTITYVWDPCGVLLHVAQPSR